MINSHRQVGDRRSNLWRDDCHDSPWSQVGLGLPTAPALLRRPALAVRSAQGWRRKQRAARSAWRRVAITAFTQLLMQVGRS